MHNINELKSYLSQVIVLALALLDEIGQLRSKQLRRHVSSSPAICSGTSTSLAAIIHITKAQQRRENAELC